ncbi:hypothetical protein PWP93_26015 [Paraburkholderia sp. A1RI-2L]|uniref:hypothetical protein n=1 Tax=Paraburkholderia sp. A1RI-2L TaxID=3028367 RepID=UPI003B821DD9
MSSAELASITMTFSVHWGPATEISIVIDSTPVLRSTLTLQRRTLAPLFASDCHIGMTCSLPLAAWIESLCMTILVSIFDDYLSREKKNTQGILKSHAREPVRIGRVMDAQPPERSIASSTLARVRPKANASPSHSAVGPVLRDPESACSASAMSRAVAPEASVEATGWQPVFSLR